MKTDPTPPNRTARELFMEALDLPTPVQREAFLDAACEGNPALRRQVEELFANHRADSFLERPAVGVDAESDVTQHTTTSPSPIASSTVRVNPTIRYFGDYELLDEIARGGMGVVYKARQKSLNRVVAVKMILGGQLATEADVRRFHTEAEAAANLKHPNIVAIHEIGEHEGRHYFSMDLIEGMNLAQAIDANPMRPHQAATLLKTIADAVHYAHQRGTLHRDLKPHNVLLDQHGQPHITDFGLARRVEQQSDLTHSGTIMGSPSYMPPEQAMGNITEIGPSSDVYALGAILYQLLTGRAPFLGATAVDTLRAVVEQEAVAPSRLNDKVPSDLETICLKCLEKRPERRYASAGILSEELERFINHEPILAKPASVTRKAIAWCRQRPWALTGASLALVLGLIGLAFGLWQRIEFLRWRMAHPVEAVPRNFDGMFGILLPAGFVLLLVSGVSIMHWSQLKRARSPIPGHLAWFVNTAGSSLVLVAIALVLLGIRTVVWMSEGNLSVVSAGLGVLPLAFAMCWTGVLVIWRFARLNDVLGVSGGQDEPPSFSLRVNRLGLLFAVPLILVLTDPLARAIIGWGQFRLPQGLAPGMDSGLIYDAAMQKASENALATMFCLLSGPIALMIFFLVTFWKMPRNEWRDLVPPIGLVSLGYAFFSGIHLPPGLAAIGTLWGGLCGFGLVRIAQIRQVAPLAEMKVEHWKSNIRTEQFKRLALFVFLGLAACGLAIVPGEWEKRLLTASVWAVLSVLLPYIAVTRSAPLRQGAAILIVGFITVLFATNGFKRTPHLPPPEDALLVIPPIVAAFVFYRAALKVSPGTRAT